MTKRIGAVTLILYIATIFAANYAVQHYGLVGVGFGLVAPAGVYFVGLALALRDMTQYLLGRKVAILAILVGAGLSYFVAPSLALASGAAFLFSESADFAVYTPLQRRGWTVALVCSTAVGAVVDSFVFLWLAFHSLEFFKGQVVGKWEMIPVALLLSAAARPMLPKREVA